MLPIMDSATVHKECQAEASREEPAIRISELAESTGVPVATIKYYLREGLMPPGRATAPNQADYDTLHEQRLRLVRVLREIGGLSIEAIRRLLAVVDDPGQSLHEVLGAAHRATGPISPANAEAAREHEELEEVDALLERLGWDVTLDAPDRRQLADALLALRTLGYPVTAETFLPYAHAADAIAANELAGLPTDAPRDQVVEYVIVGTIVYGTALSALRRLAQEHHSARRTT